jgi:hypothetical protein
LDIRQQLTLIAVLVAAFLAYTRPPVLVVAYLFQRPLRRKSPFTAAKPQPRIGRNTAAYLISLFTRE